jgi:S1-C subfamily serine protease
MLAGFPDVASVVDRVAPSVVLVLATTSQTDTFGRRTEGLSRGSGVIFDARGYILTNNHVVEDAPFVDIVLSNGQELGAEIVGTDPNTDLAVLKIDPSKVEDLVVTPLAQSNNARIGDWVIAIGNPLGFEGTVTVGVISAKDRSLAISQNRLHDLLQTDAVINPGNSGGPLLNLSGQVIGINTAIIRGTLPSGQEAEGIGFAVATTTAIPIAEQLIANGRVAWPRIGVGVDDVTPANASERGLSVDQGVLVESVATDGPAERAGIEVSDVIVALDGLPVTKFTDLRRLMLNLYAVGDTVSISVVRAAATLEIDVTLDELVF